MRQDQGRVGSNGHQSPPGPVRQHPTPSQGTGQGPAQAPQPPGTPPPHSDCPLPALLPTLLSSYPYRGGPAVDAALMVSQGLGQRPTLLTPAQHPGWPRAEATGSMVGPGVTRGQGPGARSHEATGDRGLPGHSLGPGLAGLVVPWGEVPRWARGTVCNKDSRTVSSPPPQGPGRGCCWGLVL